MTCKEVSRLLSEALDRKLTVTERAGCRLHLAICVACNRVNRQLEFLRKAMARRPGADDER
jgi:hypothetical protein